MKGGSAMQGKRTYVVCAARARAPTFLTDKSSSFLRVFGSRGQKAGGTSGGGVSKKKAGTSKAKEDEAGSKRKDVKNAKEDQRLRRLLRNRVSAQLARERKKQYLQQLERDVEGLATMNKELTEKVKELEGEVCRLKDLLIASDAYEVKEEEEATKEDAAEEV